MFWSDLGALMTTALVAYYLMFDARGLTVMHVYICSTFLYSRLLTVFRSL